jgi:hypothetical protein
MCRKLERERERLVDELGRLEQAVRDAELCDLCRLQHPVLPQRVRDDDLDGRLRSHELR